MTRLLQTLSRHFNDTFTVYAPVQAVSGHKLSETFSSIATSVAGRLDIENSTLAETVLGETGDIQRRLFIGSNPTLKQGYRITVSNSDQYVVVSAFAFPESTHQEAILQRMVSK